ncbi:MAG: protein kinase [Enhygromyxa sp.]
MALSDSRIHRGRPTPYPWEREALDFIYAGISDIDPYQAWELHELHDPSSGRLYELDLLFLSRVGLFLVEIKSQPGVLSGDVVDWTFTESGGRRRTIECPYATVNHKAKVLASLLERHVEDRPFVHAAVFTSNVTAVKLDGGRPPWLLLKDDVSSRLTNGLDDRMPRRIVNRPIMKALLQAAPRLGLRPSRTARIIGGFVLDKLVDEGEGYQEHLGKHQAVEHDRARIRSYLVPAATSTARRQQLERAARREAQTLSQLGQHPGILGYRTYVDDGPLGPAVIFETFDGALPLHAFLRQNPELSFDERLNILQAIVESVAHCHRTGVLHRNLSPASVLVRREDNGALSVRLHRFQTSTWLEHSSQGTLHVHDLAHTLDRLYQAPEVLSDPQKAIAESDVFSVGCLAWLLFTGQAPAPSLEERDQRLRASPDGGLCPSSVRPDLAALDDGISFATRPNQHERADDVAEWFEAWILDALTRPVVDASASLDPHDASKGDQLAGGLRVERRLGSGGTALVLHVRREGKDYALKIPHDPVCAERLLTEAAVLRDLRHEHIVALHEVVTLADRPCLLLDFAGERTLADLLRAEGTLSLEVARRYGDDVLSAVQYLEERGITHRDIKPSNVGFTGYEGRQKHLLLLDFSLAATEPTAVNAGTAEWRDPWLYLRGRWDAAADRFAAAAVLYHALTGVRPAQATGPGVDDAIQIDAERFDAAVRDRLGAFFRRAFARDVGERFEHAEEMRQAWQTALAPGEQSGVTPVESAIELSEVRPETPVEALSLTARARNALDRAGIRQVADLLLLPRNQLSMIRGIGTKVTKEIFVVAEALRGQIDLRAAEPLVRGFIQPRLALDDEELGLESIHIDALRAAGLTNTVDAGQAPHRRVALLIGEEPAKALAGRLEELAAAEPAPGSLADWVRELIGRKSETEAQRRLRILVGLDPLPDDQPDSGLPAARSVPEVAAAMGIEPGPIHSSLQFLRNNKWAENPAAQTLVDTLRTLLAEPAMAMADLGKALAEARCPDGLGADDLAAACALVRVALELRPTPIGHWRRLDSGPWLARDAAALDALPALAAAADQLAASEPLPSSDTVRRVLAEVVEGRPLASLSPDQRVLLAARASKTAAASARLELYPRGMSAGRALTLSLSALAGGGLTVDRLRRRVAARYPEAHPLPGRPELDSLLAPHGLVFVAELGEYLRPGQHVATSMTVQLPSRASTAGPGLPARRDPDAQLAAAFQDQLDRGIASRRFRVIQVRADLAIAAAERLGETLGVTPISLDHALAEAVRRCAVADEVEWSNIEAADRAGPEGPDWPLLVGLVRDAADAMVDALLRDGARPDAGPLVLVWPGALARYGLSSALSRLVEEAESGDTGAVLLVVPSHADGLAPSINGRLPVPAPLPGQRLQMPEPWIGNAHRAAEAQ